MATTPIRLLSVLLALLALAVPIRAVDFTWAFSGSGDWFDGKNWNPPLQLPTINDFVLFRTGTAVISSGNAFSSGANIGYDIGDNAAVIVNGNGYWEIANRLIVGGMGVGSLSITDSGSVRANLDAVIGAKAGSSGTVTVSGNGQLDVSNGVIYMDDMDGTLTIRDQAIVSAGSIGASYSGGQSILNLQGGTLRTGSIYIPVNLNGGTVVAIANNANFFGGTANTNLTLNGNGVATNTAALTFDTNGYTVTATNNFTAAPAVPSGGTQLLFEKVGSGTLTLTGNLDFSGSSASFGKGDFHTNGGTVVISGTVSSIGNGIALKPGQNATVILNSSGKINAYSVNVGGVGSGTLILDDQASLQAAYNIALGGGRNSNGTLIIASDQVKLKNSTIIQGGYDGYSGTTTVIFTHTGSLSMDNPIKGYHVTLNHNGSGITTLTGTLAYNGDTNVNAGTLLINGDASAVTTGINVKSGATLGGSGTVRGSQNFFAVGSRLTPGAENVVGSLTLNGFTMLNGEGLFDLASSTLYDRLLGNGTVIISGAAITINFLDGFDYQEGQLYSFDLLQGVTGDYLSNIQWQNLSPQWGILQDNSLTFLNGTLTFQLQQIPEPGVWMLLFAGFVVLPILRRHRSL
jgi:fibronectin-binding autotransporter adhesin